MPVVLLMIYNNLPFDSRDIGFQKEASNRGGGRKDMAAWTSYTRLYYRLGVYPAPKYSTDFSTGLPMGIAKLLGSGHILAEDKPIGYLSFRQR